jgi:hypothetical protein
MNRWQYGAVVALLVALVWAQTFPLLFPQRAAPGWEYRVEAIKDVELLNEMNRIGQAGWELTFARRALDDGAGIYEVILRRPL